ncbi:hypothetical protein M9H77_13169 [Catharanthus roseus]|uniref:Uncharacterized protein n=1 Tax=Catharanthus roseus TaxID=4058 RepID=A0ACC0BJG6_CATRO|nr:hypothetical protein M9H77_13169 [Catharanthus roseus]
MPSLNNGHLVVILVRSCSGCFVRSEGVVFIKADTILLPALRRGRRFTPLLSAVQSQCAVGNSDTVVTEPGNLLFRCSASATTENPDLRELLSSSELASESSVTPSLNNGCLVVILVRSFSGCFVRSEGVIFVKADTFLLPAPRRSRRFTPLLGATQSQCAAGGSDTAATGEFYDFFNSPSDEKVLHNTTRKIVLETNLGYTNRRGKSEAGL